MISLLEREKILWPFFALVIFAFWKADDSFFWRDEWCFMSDMRSADAAYFFKDFNGHIKPLFKLLYWLELKAFGVNTLLYLYVNLIVFSVTALYFYKLTHFFTQNKTVCFLLTLLMIANPLNFNNLLWTFQICQTLHILFQVMAVYYLLLYSTTGFAKYFYWSLIFLVAQNYSFGNGIFLPLLFVFFFLFLSSQHDRWIRLAQIIVVQIAFVLIQLFGASKSVSLNLNELGSLAYSYFYFAGVNISRCFFVKESLLGISLIGLALVSFAGIALYFILLKKEHLKTQLFLLAWIAIVCISIPIARKGIEQLPIIPYYYSVMCLIPVYLYVMYFIKHTVTLQWVRYKQYVLYTCTGIIWIYFILDQKLVNLFEVRNFNNRIAYEKAIEENEMYVAFDDPFFVEDKSKRLWVSNPEEIYQYWDQHTYYRFPGNYRTVKLADWLRK